ncbi:MAG: class I SAM-dependent methyltransferase [Gammaproteobacteria bacterium]
MTSIAESILRVCGLGTYLQIGCKNHNLVFDLLNQSIDAYGLDNSLDVVNLALKRAPDRFQQGSLVNFPYQHGFADTVIIGEELLTFKTENMLDVFRFLMQLTKHNLVIYFPPTEAHQVKNPEANRLFWEKVAILAGFRRHPRGMLVETYSKLEREQIGGFIFFERIPEAALKEFTMEKLLADRDHHMDMLREAGRRSDGHVSRYVLAASYIRPNDVVLDAACGLGYGTAVLAACSQGSKFIGIDLDEGSAAYANANYAAVYPGLSYQACDATKLAFLADQSVDTVVSFETIEHLPNYNDFLLEVKRVLKPDGRFIGSVPNLWCDETGNDPNPHHFHVFDWNRLQQAISPHFIIDARWAQNAGGGFKLWDKQRKMWNVPLDDPREVETEWWVFSANVDPLNTTNAAPATKEAYDNPWLQRMMTSQTEQLIDKSALTNFSIKAANNARVGSVDHGAALYVICEQILASTQLTNEVAQKLIDSVQKFQAANATDNYWSHSLHLMTGKLLLAAGKRNEALNAFLACVHDAATDRPSLLAINRITAHKQAGLIYLNNHQPDEAKAQFEQGIASAKQLLQGAWASMLNDEQNLSAVCDDAMQVLMMANQCVQAIKSIEKDRKMTGYFWDQINLLKLGEEQLA